jgi:hypothetical protein
MVIIYEDRGAFFANATKAGRQDRLRSCAVRRIPRASGLVPGISPLVNLAGPTPIDIRQISQLPCTFEI